ncbi:MAG: hypothetical protein QM278_12030 [Pseudomonadota bacterium]|nr:hypothetical protein [Pseudomonadota bacterium]
MAVALSIRPLLLVREFIPFLITFEAYRETMFTFIIIHCVMKKRDELWMLTLYAKSAHDNIPSHVVKAMKERFEHEKQLIIRQGT